MSGSTLGKLFSVTTWGESHGRALGCVVDGCPAGILLDEADIQIDMDRRKPGMSAFTTKRKEDDKVQILSGIFNGKTTGTPISMLVYNEDQRSKDYSAISEIYRPGHADYCYDKKYTFRDYRGGGRASGRETLARVAAGAVAKKFLNELNISIVAYTLSIAGISVDKEKFCLAERFENPFVMPDNAAAAKTADYLSSLNGNSAGGVIECLIKGVPVGIGEPVFDKLDAALAKAMLSIGAVKGIEFGLGFQSASVLGDQNNDEFRSENCRVFKDTNNSGGVLGGISDGADIVFRAAVKPTPSIYKTQKTVNRSLENCEVKISGRHDPVIVPRAVVVVEAMAAITLADFMLCGMLSSVEGIKKFYISS